MSYWGQMIFQDGMSPAMSLLINFHDHAMAVITLVMVVVSYTMSSLLASNYFVSNIYDAQEVETIWTVLPAAVLLFLAFPSLRILYLMEEFVNPMVTLKSIGHQWYWSYEYSDFVNIDFDSYMIPENDINEGSYRLLEVDNRTVVPCGVEIKMMISSADVIHAWTIPSLGLKMDAVPGRLNQIGFLVSHGGVFYGQCSEICGANHSFMPIVVESVDHLSFINWVKSFL